MVRLLPESSLDLNFPPFSEHLCSRGFVEIYVTYLSRCGDTKSLAPALEVAVPEAPEGVL